VVELVSRPSGLLWPLPVFFQGVARKAVADTAYSEPSRPSTAADKGTAGQGHVPSLQEILSKKTGYEAEAEEGAQLDGDELAAELDDLDFGDDENSGSNDHDENGSLEDDDDDDVDLR
jgi:hypothetical protein